MAGCRRLLRILTTGWICLLIFTLAISMIPICNADGSVQDDVNLNRGLCGTDRTFEVVPTNNVRMTRIRFRVRLVGQETKSFKTFCEAKDEYLHTVVYGFLFVWGFYGVCSLKKFILIFNSSYKEKCTKKLCRGRFKFRRSNHHGVVLRKKELLELINSGDIDKVVNTNNVDFSSSGYVTGSPKIKDKMTTSSGNAIITENHDASVEADVSNFQSSESSTDTDISEDMNRLTSSKDLNWHPKTSTPKRIRSKKATKLKLSHHVVEQDTNQDNNMSSSELSRTDSGSDATVKPFSKPVAVMPSAKPSCSKTISPRTGPRKVGFEDSSSSSIITISSDDDGKLSSNQEVQVNDSTIKKKFSKKIFPEKLKKVVTADQLYQKLNKINEVGSEKLQKEVKRTKKVVYKDLSNMNKPRLDKISEKREDSVKEVYENLQKQRRTLNELQNTIVQVEKATEESKIREIHFSTKLLEAREAERQRWRREYNAKLNLLKEYKDAIIKCTEKAMALRSQFCGEKQPRRDGEAWCYDCRIGRHPSDVIDIPISRFRRYIVNNTPEPILSRSRGFRPCCPIVENINSRYEALELDQRMHVDVKLARIYKMQKQLQWELFNRRYLNNGCLKS
ncbi:uncharacterized protein LOC120340672 [Styela clava]